MTGDILWLPALFLFISFLVISPVEPVLVTEGKAIVDGSAAIASTDEHFICATLDWWPPEKCDYQTCSWGHSSLLNLNLSNPILLNAIKAFSSLKLRLGGSLQDMLIYDIGELHQPCRPFVKNISQLFGFNEGCLPMTRWDHLNEFFRESGATIIFGLNALNGRVHMPDGSLGGPWNYANAASLIRYTVNKGYPVFGWELGNELSGSGVNARISAGQYAEDLNSLNHVVEEAYQGHQFKPLVIAPGGFYQENWFHDLITKTNPSSLDVITHHIYNLGAGVDPYLIEKILNSSYLDGESLVFHNLRNLLRSTGSRARAWVGEAGGAYNSGRHLVSDAFVFSFWYLDQLGMSSLYETKTYCRQTLIGGNYGLLNTLTFRPNPDYYSALLWHRLMGPKVLSTNFIGTKKIRAYAHCSKQSKGITILLLNLDRNLAAQVDVVGQTAFRRYESYHGASRARLDHAHGTSNRNTVGWLREEYHLTAMNGDLHSQIMLLNGNILRLDYNGSIPALQPVEVHGSRPIYVAPLSIVFAHIPYFYASACL